MADVGCLVKWGGKIDKVAFCGVKLLNFWHRQCGCLTSYLVV